MAEIISESDLAEYMQVTIPAGSAALVLQLTNGKVSAEIGDFDPTNPDVVAIALEVAARARRNPKGLTSQTRSMEDWTRTERWGEGDPSGEKPRTGVYLTDEERAELRGLAGTAVPRRSRSIPLRVPGFTR